MGYVVLIRNIGFRGFIVAFSCVLMIQTIKHIQSNRFDQVKSWSLICCRTKLSYIYSNHHIIIKYVGFEPINYAINLMMRHPLKFLTNLIIFFYRMYY